MPSLKDLRVRINSVSEQKITSAMKMVAAVKRGAPRKGGSRAALC
jgi:F0F1-type ATP synthase gamma subunit